MKGTKTKTTSGGSKPVATKGTTPSGQGARNPTTASKLYFPNRNGALS